MEGQTLSDIGVEISYNYYPPLFPPELYSKIPRTNWSVDLTIIKNFQKEISFVNSRNPFTRIYATWKDKFRNVTSTAQNYEMKWYQNIFNLTKFPFWMKILIFDENFEKILTIFFTKIYKHILYRMLDMTLSVKKQVNCQKFCPSKVTTLLLTDLSDF